MQIKLIANIRKLDNLKIMKIPEIKATMTKIRKIWMSLAEWRQLNAKSIGELADRPEEKIQNEG